MKHNAFVIEKKATLDPAQGSARLAFVANAFVIALAYGVFLFLFNSDIVSRHMLPLVFLLAGVLHQFITRRALTFSTAWGSWLYVMGVTVFLAALLAGTGIWGPQLPWELVAFPVCAFVLPFFVSEVWQAKAQLADEGLAVWTPTTEMLSNYPTFYFRGTPLRFRVRPGSGYASTLIKFEVSNEMDLGRIFYDLAANKEKKTGKSVALASEGGEYFSWVFSTPEGFFLQRPLDPAKTISENGLQSDDLVYVDRVKAVAVNGRRSKSGRSNSNAYV